LAESDLFRNRQVKQYELKNDKNFIEFQANSFAANFLLNENIFRRTLIEEQLSLGISRGRTGYIYLDKQKNNILDYRLIKNSLAKLFNVTPGIIDIHLKNLNMLKKGE
jgi:Zn-dependent peptidase ImmA (M78 family)